MKALDQVLQVFTGSRETEDCIKLFLSHVETIDEGASRHLFTDPCMWKTMTVGRNGVGDPYEGSNAFDDTGGFFELRDDLVFLTDKAKSCVTARTLVNTV